MTKEKQEMKKSLRQGVHEVRFTKKNGEERVLFGTTDPGLLPKISESKNENEKRKGYAEPEGIIRVYDVEAEGWRSFRVDSVTLFI